MNADEPSAERPVTIERATTDDVDHLVALESRLFAEDSGVHDPYGDVTWPAREGAADKATLLADPRSLVSIARRGGQPVGFLVGYLTTSGPTRLPVTSAVLRSLYVAASARRSGVAAGLVDDFVTWAREHGCAEAHVDHYAANVGAAAFYQQAGFVPRSVSRVLPLGPPHPD